MSDPVRHLEACLEGLLNARGVQKNKLSDWKDTGAAVNNILEAVNKLDAAGFRGPYALALPRRVLTCCSAATLTAIRRNYLKQSLCA